MCAFHATPPTPPVSPVESSARSLSRAKHVLLVNVPLCRARARTGGAPVPSSIGHRHCQLARRREHIELEIHQPDAEKEFRVTGQQTGTQASPVRGACCRRASAPGEGLIAAVRRGGAGQERCESIAVWISRRATRRWSP
eukprot:2180312-Prymnesium_polylepis.1